MLLRPAWRSAAAAAGSARAHFLHDSRACSGKEPLFGSWIRHPHLSRIENLIAQIQSNPETRVRRSALHEAQKAGIPEFVWRPPKHQKLLVEESDLLQVRGRLLLNLLGLTNFSERRGNYGLRILTIDGGGTKAVVTIEILKRLEQLVGKPTHELFDMIGGTSTGAILVMSLALKKWDLNKVEQLYMELSQNVFGMHSVTGSSRLLAGASFYDTKVLENIFKTEYPGEMMDSAGYESTPKIFCNSSVDGHTYLFRNYNPPVDFPSFYAGDSESKLWEALRATTAAPGYFDPFKRELRGARQIHLDGGVLINNPSAIAIHEAKRLWGPDVPIECLLSLGTGMDFQPKVNARMSWFSIAEALVNSATDSQRVHHIFADLFPTNVYFRINPHVTEPYLNEYRSEKLEQYKKETNIFLDAESNAEMLQRVSEVLRTRREWRYRLVDWLMHFSMFRWVVRYLYSRAM